MLSKKSDPKQLYSWTFDAIGTQWVIETPALLGDKTKQDVLRRVDEFDAVYSRFRDDSLVAQVARTAGTYTFPDDSVEMIKFYRKLYDATDGAVTPLVGDTLSALGYDKAYTLQPRAHISVPEWDDVMQWDEAIVTTTRPITLDFGAAGKGRLVDEVALILEVASVTEYVIDASGDVRHRGDEQQKIGLENPHDPTSVIGIMNVRNASLCASASNRRRWQGNLHHVVDGTTGKPTNDVIATWVVANSTMLADGLATALFFVSPDHLAECGDFQYVRMLSNNNIEHSEHFVGELFV